MTAGGVSATAGGGLGEAGGMVTVSMGLGGGVSAIAGDEVGWASARHRIPTPRSASSASPVTRVVARTRRLRRRGSTKESSTVTTLGGGNALGGSVAAWRSLAVAAARANACAKSAAD